MAAKAHSKKARQAVRGLLVTHDRANVLLIKVRSPANGGSIWMTPGGGIEKGETNEQALQREIWEETGLEIIQAGQFVFTRSFSFEIGGCKFSQFEKYFLLFVDKFNPVMDNNPAVQERNIFQEFRWWGIDQITLSSALFAPPTLGTQLSQLLENQCRSEAVPVKDFSRN